MAFGMAETAELAVELSLKGNFSSGLKTAQSQLKGFDKATSRTQASIGKFSSNVSKGLKIGAAAAAGGLLLVVNAAADYESAFAGVRKTVDLTEEEFVDLSKSIRDMAKTMPIGASELARLGETAGALGIEGAANIEEFIRVTALLGVTTDLTADDAATSLGILANVLHLTGDEYDNFASALVALGNAGASTESQIISIAERAGAAGELVGVSTEQVLAFSSAVASLGIEPEAGGTALQKFFIDTAKFIAEGGEQLELFADISGTSAKQIKKNFDKDAGAALTRFLANLGKLSQGEQILALKQLGFDDARITRTLLGLAGNTELVADQMRIANEEFDKNTALTEEAQKRFATFESQLGITKNVLNDIAIVIGSKLLPKLTPLLQRLNTFINENQGAIEKFGDDLAKAFENVATAVGKTDWTPFIDGLKLSASLAKGAFDAFNALPDDFKKLILVGAGINKITGGLITSIGKDLGTAIGGVVFDKFLARGSSPANPLWVQSVGGVGGPGVPGAGGTGGGILGKLGAVALGVTIIGVATEAATALAEAINPGVTKETQGAGNRQPQANADPNIPVVEQLRTYWGEGSPVVGAVRDPKLQNVTNERLEAIRALEAEANSKRITESQSERTLIANAATAQTAAQERHRQATVAAQAAINAASTSEKSSIAMASASQVAAQERNRQAAFAVRDAVDRKDLTVTNTINVSNKVSIADLGKTVNTYSRLYNVAS